MCGIFGVVGGRHEQQLIESAVDRLHHRGPDDRGIERLGSANQEVWLGMRRLAILDPSERGHQPMTDAQRELWLVFNGEIYNFRDLRAELQEHGYRFRSNTDTEVVLYAYRQWGEQALDRFLGMFAFALWDMRSQQLLLARDRLGEKPLYYHAAPGRLAFASEIKALLALPGIERRLNPEAAARFFNFLWVPDPETLFEGIQQLEPGCLAVYRNGSLATQRYWEVPLGPASYVREAEAAESLEVLLYDATAQRLISDVPLGAFLSGGVDSSLIVALMRRAGIRHVITQTATYPPGDAKYEIERPDAPYARRVRDFFGDLDYHEVVLRPDVVELLPKLVWHLDNPVADPAAMSTYLLCRAAKHRATVMLSGMGAEELFAGYGRYRASLLGEQYRRVPRVLREHVVEPVVEQLPGARPGALVAMARNAKKFVRSAGREFAERYLGYSSYYSRTELQELLAFNMPAESVYARHRELLRKSERYDPITRMTYVDLQTFLPSLNLAYTDRASMAASVEVRTPFLDHRVVEFVAGLPGSLKIRGRRQKYVLKRVAAGCLPREIVVRRKSGFSAPVRAWLARDLRTLISDILAPERIRRRGVLSPAAVWRSVHDLWAGREDNALRVWAFLTFELWAQTFLDRGGESSLSI